MAREELIAGAVQSLAFATDHDVEAVPAAILALVQFLAWDALRRSDGNTTDDLSTAEWNALRNLATL